MTTNEHLDKIVAKCKELLAVAEKRTPGRWVHDTSIGTLGDVITKDMDAIAQCQARNELARDREANNSQRNLNAAFIASCAGAAEAGWRATIAAIEGLQRPARWNFQGWEGDHEIVAEIEAEVDAIISAWPEELLS